MNAVAAAAQVPAALDDVRIVVDARPSPPAVLLQPELFGVAWNWLDSGGGALTYVEMVRDRSFRNQADVMKRAWNELPDRQAGGRIRHERNGGHAEPWGGKAYPGYLVLSQKTQGSTCISQTTLDGTVPGERYELHLSARSDGGAPMLSAFFADGAGNPVEVDDNLSTPGSVWATHRFVLQPAAAQVPGVLVICLRSAGAAAIDEVRLQRIGAKPQLKPLADRRIREELGARSLRWPTGSDADYFDWRESIGPLRERGEVPSAFGDLQTPSLGLHEFLDYCEVHGIVPLVTVNVREPAERSAALVEYVLGDATTTQGAIRKRNGRQQPWNVRHFELGNEPTDAYRAEFGSGDAAKGYVKLASATSAAMRAKARELRRPIELQGVLEAGFASADWIWLVPMLSRWNGTVLDRKTGVLAHVDAIKGNFYSGFNWRTSDEELFEQVMAGGATLAGTVRRLQREHGPLPAFWLTEYSVLVQKKKLIGGDEIQLDRAKDFQAGLAAADLLMTAIQERFGGAYLFNLAQHGTWGVLGNPADFRLRPAGLVFSMLSRMAGQRSLPVKIEGAPTITLTKGDGTSPANTRYATVTAVASESGGIVQLVMLNRSYGRTARVRVDIDGASPMRAELHQLGPEALTAGNDNAPDAVRIKSSATTLRAPDVTLLPPRSVLRVVYRN